ncbi:response regulator with CheY-like receiver domain and winged-helix DNA-binding domain [Schinkia azotoformans MEV2011]|uniref:Response regulator with CheY-like receiver domain and winged-helix DNA-binding domain n=1 Tax=Schinkia azotoformans MEV2011 TaxID=1348973 RepID=A0A072NW12_SCHAZ|nr:response regulator transcription factor [Schinkia azotoformans]KEF37440.1 response regulator with CheY-like receiver domain and winged-helix DNA-binding domain [Schinkia azotoformans MEV2011]MEC1697715.1 response regulator transcription factor [Schinkia azotoformans]MEC1726182.1 response regulator transcription factor [Schinkia azotoformans]MEC1770508.1 response regulator transcription factor [Schinkia azotoformans]MEC1780029.1 response regulator transcription factor [Schinkia azotoformans]
MKRLLVVDDEARMLQLLKLYLEPHGFECITKTSGHEAINYLADHEVDLVLLDIMMPEIDGWATAKLIRGFSNVPIIMLTARDQSSDMVKGLGIGADDYITKPFEEEILLARIHALLRRVSPPSKIEENGLIWDEGSHELTYNDEAINLTPKEFEMIGLLIHNKKTVFSREKLIESIWGLESNTEGRTVDSHIRNIRDKCRKAGFPIEDHLKTVWGLGYKWE